MPSKTQTSSSLLKPFIPPSGPDPILYGLWDSFLQAFVIEDMHVRKAK
jgi:hypothetical protein